MHSDRKKDSARLWFLAKILFDVGGLVVLAVFGLAGRTSRAPSSLAPGGSRAVSRIAFGWHAWFDRRDPERAKAGFVFVMILGCLDPTGARAGAWNEEVGHGIVINDFTFSGGSRYFDGTGKLSAAAAYSKQEAIGYIEYGVTDWLTAIVKPSLSAMSLATAMSPGSPTAHYSGLGTAEAGAQLQLATFGPAVFAVQGTFGLPGTTSKDDEAMIGNTAYDMDLRGMAGRTFRLGRWDAFVDAQAGYRFRSGGASAEWRADVTVGIHVRPRLLILVQSFNVLCTGRGTPWFPAASSTKLSGSAVYDLSDRWSVEAGLFQTLWGEGALRERGLKAAVWYRF